MRLKPLALLAVAIMLLSLAACTPTAPAATNAPTNAPGSSAAATPAAAVEPIEYSFLMCWNGGAAAYPDGWDKSDLAKAIAEKTGVTLKVETITSSEREKLATVFASGDLPDITNAPYWSTDPGGEGELIKNAGVEGLLLPLKDYIDQYPNIKRLYDVGVISQKYLDSYINNPEYNGEIYVIPTQTGRGQDDVRDWAYNLFARKDILASLNITPESVTTEDAVYDLLTKIKNGNFTDINGKPVIPGSTWHNGWDYSCFLRGFNPGGVTENWMKTSDGKVVNKILTDNIIDRTLYMRKLVNEGLMDAECFTQTDTMAKEKMITGRVAVFGCHYPNEYGFFKGTLYVTNPEMEYVPLGPILDEMGGVPSQVERIGRTGSPVLILSKEIKDPEHALSYIDFLNSDEGIIMTEFGIEGMSYTMDNGVPKLTADMQKIKDTDSNQWNLLGFGAFPGTFTGADPSLGNGWDADYQLPGYVHAREINPLKFIDYKTVDDVVSEWPGKANYDTQMSTINIDDEYKKAFLAKSDDEAKAIIENIRNKMKAAGDDDMEKFVNDAVSADPKILN
jgi:putative aldouronate transport system substrate-binding protein